MAPTGRMSRPKVTSLCGVDQGVCDQALTRIRKPFSLVCGLINSRSSEVQGHSMSFFRSVGIAVCLACLLLGVVAAKSKPAAQAPARAAEQAPALLPEQFEGWQMQGAPRI